MVWVIIPKQLLAKRRYKEANFFWGTIPWAFGFDDLNTKPYPISNPNIDFEPSKISMVNVMLCTFILMVEYLLVETMNGAIRSIRNHLPAVVPGLTGIIDIAAGEVFSMALKSDGTVWVWGYNGYGQRGNGTRYPEQQISGTTITRAFCDNITSIAAGYHHAVAINSKDEL